MGANESIHPTPPLAEFSSRDDPGVITINEIIKEFNHQRYCSYEQLEKLWRTILCMIKKYPYDEYVTETVSTACTLAAKYRRPVNSEQMRASVDLMTSVLSALSQFNWQQHESLGPFLIKMVNSLHVCFCNHFLQDTFLPEVTAQFAGIYYKALDVDTYNGSPRPAIVIGALFPSCRIFSVSELKEFVRLGVHKKLRTLLCCYDVMEEEELCHIIDRLSEFLSASKECAAEYFDESIHFFLLHAANKFLASAKCQSSIWKLFRKLCSLSKSTFVNDIDRIIGIIVNLLEALWSKNNPVQPIISFLHDCTDLCPTTAIPCFLNDKKLIQLLVDPLVSPNPTSHEAEDIGVISQLLSSFFKIVEHTVAVDLEVLHEIVQRLEEASLKWPIECTTPFCIALESLVIYFTLPLESQNSKNSKFIQNLFYSDNHLETIKQLLKKEEVPVRNDRLNLYIVTKNLIKRCPSDTCRKWLSKDFLEVFIPSLIKDAEKLQDRIEILSITLHYIVYMLMSKEMTQVLVDLKLHEGVVNVLLKLSCTNDTLSATLNLLHSLVRQYHTYLQDLGPIIETELPSRLINLAKTMGTGNKSDKDITSLFNRLALNLSLNNKSSKLLHNKGFLDELYPLISDSYDPLVQKTAVHTIGNIALMGDTVKQEIIAHKVHERLFNILDQRISSHDDGLLSACCRLLRILASGEYAKFLFAKSGLMSILLRMAQAHQLKPGSNEVRWLPFALMSSLGFVSLVNKRYVLTDQVLRVTSKTLASISNSNIGKEADYSVLVFLAGVDLDMIATVLEKLNVFHELQHKMKKPSSSDFKRWGKSLLEKGQLFTLTVGQELMAEEGQREMVNSLEGSLLWPEEVEGAPAVVAEEETSSNVRTPIVFLPEDDERFLVPQFPTAIPTSEEDKLRLTQLGLTPDKPFFRVGRFCGNNHSLCSNCDDYLRSEELVFRPHSLTPQQYQLLIDRGWYRRGSVKMYRFRFNHSIYCSDWETRVLLSQFNQRSRKSFKKVLRRIPAGLTIETVPTHFNRESYDLYNQYHLHKHDKPAKSVYSYAQHVVNSPLRSVVIDGFEYGTFHQLYRLDGKLVAVGLIDVVPNGVVSLYMWYSMSKEMQKLSLGVYSALKEIEYAQELSKRNPNIKYYYLQGWNGNNTKLSYKANYTPEEFYSPCTVTDWVSGLDGVKKAQEEAKEKWNQKNSENTDGGEDPKNVEFSFRVVSDKLVVVNKTLVPGEAMELDRLVHQRLTGSSSVDIGHLVVCLNNKKYLSFSELLSTYQFEEEHRSLLETRLEELVLALGPELSSNMIVDMKACPPNS